MIIDYLEGRCELDAIRDQDKCAICAAMEKCWVWWNGWSEGFQRTAWIEYDYAVRSVGGKIGGSIYFDAAGKRIGGIDIDSWTEPAFVPDYLRDGTAALRLVERFGLCIWTQNWSGDWERDEPDYQTWVCAQGAPVNGVDNLNGVFVNADTPQAAIVAAVCALAREQWPYKVCARRAS